MDPGTSASWVPVGAWVAVSSAALIWRMRGGHLVLVRVCLLLLGWVTDRGGGGRLVIAGRGGGEVSSGEEALRQF